MRKYIRILLCTLIEFSCLSLKLATKSDTCDSERCFVYERDELIHFGRQIGDKINSVLIQYQLTLT